MARSYSIQFTGAVGAATHPQLCIYMATAAGIRPKIFEFDLGSHGTPADNASEYTIQRHTTAAPSGGAAPAIDTLDAADPAALASSYDAATGGCTMSTVLYMVGLNMRATFRWVAAPGKEFVIPNTQWAGAGIRVVAQTAAYNTDTSLLWEE